MVMLKKCQKLDQNIKIPQKLIAALKKLQDQKKKETPTEKPALDGKQIVSLSANELNEKIVDKGNLIRKLKSEKASKSDIEIHVKELLSLKAAFKSETGTDWKPDIILPKSSAATTSPIVSISANELNEKIVDKGNVIRKLKSEKASKSDIDIHVKELLSLKAAFKSETG